MNSSVELKTSFIFSLQKYLNSAYKSWPSDNTLLSIRGHDLCVLFSRKHFDDEVSTNSSVFRVEIAFAFSAKPEFQSFLLIDLYYYRTHLSILVLK